MLEAALEFGQPWLFALLPLPLIIVWLVPPYRETRTALRAPFFKTIQTLTGSEGHPGAVIRARSLMRRIALWLVWALLVTALSSPRLVGEPEMIVKEGRDFLVAVDLSGSMQTNDFVNSDGDRITRLEAVRSVFVQFLSRREGDRVGLIVFGSEAYLDAPLTTDLDGITAALRETEIGLAGQETAIGNAIGLSLQLFEADSVESRVLLLITDGVDSGSELTPSQAARAAVRDSITIYTIGVGQAGIGGADLDEDALRDIANLTGGEYFNGNDNDALVRITQQLDELEPVEFEEASNPPVALLYHWPLGLLIIIVLVQQFVFSVGSKRVQT